MSSVFQSVKAIIEFKYFPVVFSLLHSPHFLNNQHLILICRNKCFMWVLLRALKSNIWDYNILGLRAKTKNKLSV